MHQYVKQMHTLYMYVIVIPKIIKIIQLKKIGNIFKVFTRNVCICQSQHSIIPLLFRAIRAQKHHVYTYFNQLVCIICFLNKKKKSYVYEYTCIKREYIYIHMHICTSIYHFFRIYRMRTCVYKLVSQFLRGIVFVYCYIYYCFVCLYFYNIVFV